MCSFQRGSSSARYGAGKCGKRIHPFGTTSQKVSLRCSGAGIARRQGLDAQGAAGGSGTT